jgi:hypothetical protein
MAQVRIKNLTQHRIYVPVPVGIMMGPAQEIILSEISDDLLAQSKKITHLIERGVIKFEIATNDPEIDDALEKRFLDIGGGIPVHGSSHEAGGSDPINADNLSTSAGAAGEVLTADGFGGVIWQIPPVSPHAVTHKHGGVDEVAISSPAPNEIPKALATGKISTGWLNIGTGAGQVAAGDDSRFPTADEKLALAGTTGSPDGANRFVTDSDPRMTNARTPTLHAATHAKYGVDQIEATTLAAWTAPGSGYVLSANGLGSLVWTLPTGSVAPHGPTHAPGGSDPIRGIGILESVETTTTGLGNITLAGEQTLNGLLTSNSRVLVTDQTNAAENGIYVTSGAAWARAADADAGDELRNGNLTSVINPLSTKYAYQYVLTTPDPVVIGIIGQTWEELDATRSNFFNGTVEETFSAVASSDGVTVTLSLEQDGGGDLLLRFSDNYVRLDCTPAQTIALVAGSDSSPTQNYVYIPRSTKALTVSTTDWPATEHVKIAYLLVPSAAFVQANGVYVIQNWNDHDAGTNGQGHLSHLAEHIRLTSRGGVWHSGANPTVNITTNVGTPDNVDVQVSAGVVFQAHRHITPALDTSTGSTVLVINNAATPYLQITDLNTQLADSTGASMADRFFSLVLWGVANKSGTYTPLMLNLPGGSYNNLNDALADVDGYDVYSFPAPYQTESSTGYLLARFTFQHSSASGGTWTLEGTVDLRGTVPAATFGGGSAGALTEFSDNQFKILDDLDPTKVMAFEASGITSGNTRTLTIPDASGTIGLLTALNPTNIVPGDVADVGTGTDAARADHTHGVQAFAAPGVIQPDDTTDAGTATTFVRSDHRHGITTDTPTNILVSQTAAEGTSTAFARADHIHGTSASGSLADLTKEPTGFPNRIDSVVSFAPSPNRRFTIAPAVTSFDFYINGVKFTKNAAETIDLPNTTGLWFIYYDNTGTLQASLTPWNYGDNKAFVATVYWNTAAPTQSLFGDERHGLVMDWQTHEYLHRVERTRYISGFPISGYVLDSDVDADVQFGLGNGSIIDEDILMTIVHAATPSNPFEQVLADPAQIPVVYRDGAGGAWLKDTATTFPFKNTGTGRIAWNQDVAGTWQQTETPNNDFVAYWIWSTNDPNEPIISTQGQRTDGTLALARSNNGFDTLNLGALPSAEWKLLYRVIYQTGNGFGGTRKAKLQAVDDFRTAEVQPGIAAAATDHSSLTGLSTGDDHTQYLLRSDLLNAYDATVRSTTATTWLQALRISVGPLVAGTYRLGWSYNWNHDDTGSDFLAQIEQNDTTQLYLHQQEPQDDSGTFGATGTDQKHQTGGFMYLTLVAGSYTFDLDFSTSATGKTSSIWNSRLEFWRII